eukprot:TRINITY_DN10165_c0_g1_i11.p1 TRINITY_DN10165_c0_g1~~TRINITY_DN10165_c0_g1_i11.p1  ORF type:complete len:438 (+),score=99.94 TRINITY_DN10165_c0_g1_i11:105-1418(+)
MNFSFQEKIEELYKDLKKHKYILLSILIHEGNAELGHYYAYIHDYENKKWWRFNDISVAEESEDKIFSEAFGGKDMTQSAYCLVYVREKALLTESKQSLRRYSSSIENAPDQYSTFIPERIRKDVDWDNERFFAEIEDFKNSNTVKLVKDKYASRIDLIQEFLRRFRNPKAFCAPPILNFAVYLRNEELDDIPNSAAPSERVKLFILDQCLEEMGISLEDLNKNNISLQDKLLTHFSALNQKYSLATLSFNKKNHAMEALYAGYIAERQAAIAAATMMEILIKDPTISEALACCDFLLELYSEYLTGQLKNGKKRVVPDYFTRLGKEMLKMLMLRIASYVNDLHKTKKLENMLTVIDYLVAFGRKHFKENDHTFSQVKVGLNDVLKRMSPKEWGDPAVKSFEAAIKKINEPFNPNKYDKLYAKAHEVLPPFGQLVFT